MAIGEEIFRPGSSSDGEVRAGILVTGTEVLTATIRDDKRAPAFGAAERAGVELVEILVVADHPGDPPGSRKHEIGPGST